MSEQGAPPTPTPMHWFTLAEIERRVVDHHGRVDVEQFSTPDTNGRTSYQDADDLVAFGLVRFAPGRIRVTLTARGWTIAHALRWHLGQGKGYATFTPPVIPPG